MGNSTWDVAIGTLLTKFSTIYKWSRAGTFGTQHELGRDLKNYRNQLLAEICFDLRGKINSFSRALLDSSYGFMTMLIVHTYTEISILLCQVFSEKNILSLLSNQLRDIFDDLYWGLILGRGKMGYFNVDETAAMLWGTLQSHEVVTDFSKHKIKCHS